MMVIDTARRERNEHHEGTAALPPGWPQALGDIFGGGRRAVTPGEVSVPTGTRGGVSPSPSLPSFPARDNREPAAPGPRRSHHPRLPPRRAAGATRASAPSPPASCSPEHPQVTPGAAQPPPRSLRAQSTRDAGAAPPLGSPRPPWGHGDTRGAGSVHRTPPASDSAGLAFPWSSGEPGAGRVWARGQPWGQRRPPWGWDNPPELWTWGHTGSKHGDFAPCRNFPAPHSG